MVKPNKPRKDFPLFPHNSGQWAKVVKTRTYYFGSWKADPKGEVALKDWLARKDSIIAGVDSLKVERTTATLQLAGLADQFLEAKRLAVQAGDLSPYTLRDYNAEIARFVNTVGPNAEVAKLQPTHFLAYADKLVEWKLDRHARKRVIAYIKAMFNWGAGGNLIPPPVFGTRFTAPSTTPEAISKSKARAGKKDHSKRIIAGGEIDKLLERSTPQFKAIILLALNCGLGGADIGRLRWRDIDMATGKLSMPRGKTGAARVGYLWKKTRERLERVMTLKHNRLALAKEGQEALVFISRKGLPMHRESVTKEGVKTSNAVSYTFSKMAKELGLEGVTFYRLRHTFKTLGKKAKDRDALNLAMGHIERTIGAIYDHEEISFSRIRRVARKVYRRLWPVEKGGHTAPVMRLVTDDHGQGPKAQAS
jgi:integrase